MITIFNSGQKVVDVADDHITIVEGELKDNKQQYTLSISNLIPEKHAGPYTCVLIFCDGDNLEAKIEVTARKATMIDVAGDVESHIIVTGERLTARCRSQGDKAPIGVTWTKDGAAVEMDKVRILQNTNTMVFDNSIQYFGNLTIKNFAFSDEGSYKCAFTYGDGYDTEASVIVKHARITNEKCLFVDYRLETSKALSCTYHGSAGASAVSFTTPDNSVKEGELSKFVEGTDADTPGTQTGSYTIESVSDTSSGPYTCTFTVNGGTPVSALQRFSARSKYYR